MMLDFCSDTYSAAREKFLRVAARRNAHIHSVPHPETGAHGEELAMDFALFGDRAAEKTLLLVSGTHGQEGLIGSAIQSTFLDDLEIPVGVNILALHALNPWGFSHLSRSDDRNIDVNRNFLDFGEPLPQSPIYMDAHPEICPDEWGECRLKSEVLATSLVERYGLQPALDALTGGQFDVPTGLNFGGHAPSWSNRTVSAHLPPLLAGSRQIAFVEWHTGLGAYGELCHICMHDPQSEAFERVWNWMGEEAKASFLASMDNKGTTASYNGLFCNWLPQSAPQAEWVGQVIEVGTYDNVRVWEALRIDRWLRFGRPGPSDHRDDLRREMLERFYPSSPDWRRMALAVGCQAQQHVLDGLVRW